MKYVVFWNVFTDAMQDGFLVEESETSVSLCTPIIKEWFEKKGETEKIKNYVMTFEKTSIRLLEKPYVSPYEDWVYAFSIQEKEEKTMVKLSSFFEWFFYYKQKKCTPFEALEKTIYETKRSIPHALLQDLVAFVLERYRDEPERLRTIFSTEIQDVLSRKT